MIPLREWLRAPLTAGGDGALDGEPDSCAEAISECGDEKRAYEAGYAEGRREGELAARLAFELDVAKIRGEMTAEAARAEASARDEAARQLWASISAALDAMRHGVENAVAQLLEPLLIERFRQLALDAFSECLAGHLGGEASRIVSIHAPEDMRGVIQSRLAEAGYSPSFQPAPEGECAAVLDSGGFETCLREWEKTLRKHGHG